MTVLFIIDKSENNPNVHQMVNENVVYPYNGISSNHKQECSTDTWYIMGEGGKHYAKTLCFKKKGKKMFKYKIHNLLHAFGKKFSHYRTVFLTIKT